MDLKRVGNAFECGNAGSKTMEQYKWSVSLRKTQEMRK